MTQFNMIPFGRFEGKHISKIPRNDLMWICIPDKILSEFIYTDIVNQIRDANDAQDKEFLLVVGESFADLKVPHKFFWRYVMDYKDRFEELGCTLSMYPFLWECIELQVEHEEFVKQSKKWCRQKNLCSVCCRGLIPLWWNDWDKREMHKTCWHSGDFSGATRVLRHFMWKSGIIPNPNPRESIYRARECENEECSHGEIYVTDGIYMPCPNCAI